MSTRSPKNPKIAKNRTASKRRIADASPASTSIPQSLPQDGTLPTWTTPLPLLDPLEDVESIDLGLLFPTALAPLGRYAKAAAAHIQVSPLLVAPTMMSVASIAATGACCFLGRNGHREVPVVWHMTLAAPGERKSATLKLVSEPLFAEGDESPVATDAVPPAELPTYPTAEILAMDASRAALYEQMASHHGRLAVLTDEDHIVGSLAKGGSEGPDIFLKGWSGDTLMKQRKGVTTILRNPNLVLSFMVQPSVAQLAIGNDLLRGRGFPQRFLYTSAPSVSECSYLDSRPMPTSLVEEWSLSVQRIASLPRRQRDRTIPLQAAALQRFGTITDNFHAEIKGGNLDLFEREWLAKAHGQVLRIAGLLALLRDADTRSITEAEVRAAEAWVDLSHRHLRGLLRSVGGGDVALRQAQRVLNWLQQQRLEVASESEITQALRGPGFETVAAWRPVFELLTAKGWLRPQRLDAGGAKGGRPSYGYAVNPALHLGTLAA